MLVGQILGGAIAARFAARHGHRIRRLVLVDSLGLEPFQPAPEFGRALQGFLGEPNERTHDALWRRCAFDLDRLRDRLGERWEDRMVSSPTVKTGTIRSRMKAKVK